MPDIFRDNMCRADFGARNTKRRAYLGAKLIATIVKERVSDLHHGNMLPERNWNLHSLNLRGRSYKYRRCMHAYAGSIIH